MIYQYNSSFHNVLINMMSTLEQAIILATQQHSGQLDKGGQPYILHPLRVMLNVQSIDEKIVAVLHDVLEDTHITADDLLKLGFSSHIVDAIIALTKYPNETRLDAAHRARLNPIARRVKIADVTDNMDLTRIVNPTEKDHLRMQQYVQVLKLLNT